MSSILKALRKLEDEKANMGEGSVDLAHDILKRSYEDKRSSSAWKFVTLIAVVLLLGAGYLVFLPSVDSPQPTVRTAQDLPSLTVPPQSVQQPTALPVVVMPDLNRKIVKPPSVSTSKTRPPAVKETVAISAKTTSSAPVKIPDLLLEEIVYVEDPSARLAVVNDLPVMQGTDIDGARVIEILSDRVRFEYHGIQFDMYKQ